MKARKLVMALGLVAVLLVAGGVAGCSSVESEPPANGQSANPMEEMEKPSESHEWEGKLSDIPGYPEGMPIMGGMIRKVTSNTLDLEAPSGSAVIYNDEYEPGSQTKIVQVVFNPDTKVYRWLHRVAAEPELEEMTLDDLTEGQWITVWGEETGDRIFADTIITRQ